MTHIYEVQRPVVANVMRRKSSIAEINLLRKFEGSKLIEERISRQLGKLHALWFKTKR